ncbi:maltase A3-like [Anopheles ziemanni]|uniref:maltase A3-like n=1 Tax=Anopheles coustani TaxID=139045 RepID=UPI00265B04C9|nr:maltase A3-like [Anopheles coustani]XP_058170752.1 maltase A3-like [Anopheles ziemanni]
MWNWQRAIVVIVVIVPCLIAGAELATRDWWQKAAFYQIYPRSFMDSDGDGVGDLNGITSKLPYLKSIGVKAFWMSPIYKSPMVDFGYDISDFRDIHEEFGTMADFDRLVEQAKALDLKVIMDFVPNHSSNKHEWFIKSENRVAGYEDYYVWHDGKTNPAGGRNLPPNNWIQAFRGSAWEWSETRQQYYLHQFTVEQPDLNYRNPTVVQEMKDILTFWLDKGVDGFRIDAVPTLYEDEELRDEPPSGLTEDTEDTTYLSHVYTQDLPETVEMVYQWRVLVDAYQTELGGDTRLMMTEAYSSLDVLKTYYQSTTGELGSHMPFNFRIITELNAQSVASDYVKVVEDWMNILPAGQVPNWVMGNHDRSRVGSRMGVNRIDALNMILLSLSGASVTYQGEEIGMTDVEISWKDTVDPAACNAGEELYAGKSRDPCRTPFQWDSTSMAGFTNGSKTWLPVGPLYQEVNVQVQEEAEKSHLKVYRAMTELRKTKTFQLGSVKAVALKDTVLAVVRELANYNTYITLANLGDQLEVISAAALADSLPSKLYFDVVSVGSHNIRGSAVATKDIVLLPNEAFVLKAHVAPFEKLYSSICDVWLQ